MVIVKVSATDMYSLASLQVWERAVIEAVFYDFLIGNVW